MLIIISLSSLIFKKFAIALNSYNFSFDEFVIIFPDKLLKSKGLLNIPFLNFKFVSPSKFFVSTKASFENFCLLFSLYKNIQSHGIISFFFIFIISPIFMFFH